MASYPPKNKLTEARLALTRAMYQKRKQNPEKFALLNELHMQPFFGDLLPGKKYFRTNADIQTAVNLWCANRAEAEERYGHISDWDVSSVTDMSDLFRNKREFNDDIRQWDVSNVTDMKKMFWGARTFNQAIGNWDVSKVTNMSLLFYQSIAFNQPIGG
jgi:hypothetical protein